MVGDGWDGRFGDDFRQRQGQGDIQRQTKYVLWNEQIELEVVDEPGQMFSEIGPPGVHPGRIFAAASDLAEEALEALANFRVAEMGLGDDQAALGRPVAQAGKIVAVVAHLLEHLGPFGRFQRDAVGARKAKRDEANV